MGGPRTLLTMTRLLPTTRWLSLTAYCLLPTAYFLLPTTRYGWIGGRCCSHLAQMSRVALTLTLANA